MSRRGRLVARVTVTLVIGCAGWALLTLPPARHEAGPAAEDPSIAAGAFHVHTNRSDGSGSPDQVAEAAAGAGLRFVVLTDHGNGTRPPDPPRYHSGVLIVDGVEITTSGGHYAALDLPVAPYPLGGEARDVVEDVGRLGGFGVVTHPGSPKPALSWQDWSLPVEAFEWLNGDSEWRDEGWTTLLRSLFQYPVRPVETLAALVDRPDPVLARWDAVTADRSVVALAGADAHARLQLGGDDDEGYGAPLHLAIPSYERAFRAFSVRAQLDSPLTGEADVDGPLIMDAIKRGRVYTVVDGLAAAPPFVFQGRRGERRVGMGERIEGDGPVIFDVTVGGPAETEILLLRGGRVEARSSGQALTFEATGDPAAYRVEVRLSQTSPDVPWLLGNPIYVGPATHTEPPPAVEAARTIPIDVGTAWAIERDADSGGVLEIAGSAADQLRISYTLGDGRATSPYVAVSHAWPEDAADADGLAFVGYADRPLRLSVQIRSPGAPEPYRWRRSVYLSPEARRIRIPFAELRPVGTSPERPDLSRVDSLLFVADTENAVPGTSASIWLGEIRVEAY